MASQKTSRALRLALRQASAPRVQQRTFLSAVRAASRPSLTPSAASTLVQQTRGVKTVDFAGVKEDVYERDDWPRDKLLVTSPAPSNISPSAPPNSPARTTSKMIPLPSSGTARRATARVSTFATMASTSSSACARTAPAGRRRCRMVGCRARTSLRSRRPSRKALL